MSTNNCTTKKIHVIGLIITLLFLSNCTVYRHMKPTQDYTMLSREKEKEVYTFRAVQMPEPRDPSLIIEFGKYQVFKENRNVKYEGQKKTYYAAAWLALAGGGFALAASKWDVHELQVDKASGDTTKFYLPRTLGLTAGIIGGLWAIFDLASPWKPASKYSSQTISAEYENDFEPLANRNIKVSSSSINMEKNLLTDARGRVILDITETIPVVPNTGSLEIQFELSEDYNITDVFTIPASFFSEFKAYQAYLRSLKLDFNSEFFTSDGFPVKEVNKSGSYVLAITPTNVGDSDAKEITVSVRAPNGIKLTRTSQIIKTINAGATGENLFFPFTVDNTFSQRSVNITVYFKQDDYEITKKDVAMK